MKNFCFTHYDLDGASSYLMLRWVYGGMPYKKTTPTRFREDFTQWLVSNNINDYDKIFILDLDVSDSADLIDRKNVFIIDHHISHELAADYKHATAIVKDYPSAAKLSYKVFEKLHNIELDNAQKTLILLANDYDSYKLEIEASKKLNTIFWYQDKGFDNFIVNFAHGFKGFSRAQENIIKFIDDKIDNLKDTLNIYAGKVKIQGKERYVCATFSNKYINETAEILINSYNADIAIVVNQKMNRVSWRRGKDVEDIDLQVISKKLCNGGGHKYAAGGEITENFLQFTKLLSQIK